ncbi:SurA N-terminal domain-containing protein [Streptomyces sp. NPDC059740]|uniref:SurA N-terminal domain-containing protein n=1 Tax=Streptomyces sp. NPDC059740 TaxID=3346926 RepID=UPI003652512C
MFRRRTVLSVSAAAAIVAATPLLAACGSQAHPGAAAVVDGRRITVSQLQAQVAGVREAQYRAPQSAQLVQGSGTLSLVVLNRMVFDRVVARDARDAGVKVSDRQVQSLRASYEKSAGGATGLKQLWLQQQGIAPDEIDTTVRNQLLMDGVAKHLGVDRSRPEGQQALVKSLAATSKKMGIDVNPRYGTWNDDQVTLGQAKEAWITPPATATATSGQ